MFVIDGVVYAVDPPPGESKWGYGPTVFLLCLVRAASESRDDVEGANAPSSRRVARQRPRASSGDASRGDDASDARRESRRGRGGTRPRARDRARFTKRRREGRRETTRGESTATRGPAKAFATTDGARCARNDAQIASFLWGAVSIRKTERAHRRRAHAPARDEDARRVDVAEHGRVDDDDGDERDDEDYAKRNDDESAPRRRCCNF